MKKYILTLIFYITSFAIAYFLNMYSPNAPDGGLGFAAISILLMMLVVLVLVGVNIYKGVKTDKEYLIIAGIHVAVLTMVIFTLFI